MKKWLVEKFLPMWAKETVLADNRRLKRENEQLRQKLRQSLSYIDGMEKAMKYTKRRNSGGK